MVTLMDLCATCGALLDPTRPRYDRGELGFDCEDCGGAKALDAWVERSLKWLRTHDLPDHEKVRLMRAWNVPEHLAPQAGIVALHATPPLAATA